MRPRTLRWLPSLALLLAACATRAPVTPAPPTSPARTAEERVTLAGVLDPDVRLAEIALLGKNGARLEGRVALFEVDRGVLVVIDVEGAAAGRYAAHLHERGDCSDPDGVLAGGHWNPDHVEHGLPPYLGRHLGDLGNLEVGPAGTGHLEVMLPDANLEPGHRRSALGRALLLKSEPDDGGQPFGGAFDPIACGVVTGWGVSRGGLIGARYR